MTFMYAPVLEPNLYRSLGHADVLGNTLTDESSGSGVLVEFDLECDKLVLGRTLTLLVLLLLCERALARRPPGSCGRGSTRRGRCGLRRCHARLIVVLWLRKLRCLHDVRHDYYCVLHLVFELRSDSCRLPFSVKIIIGSACRMLSSSLRMREAAVVGTEA